MKYGLHTSGKVTGPIDQAKVNESGWTWFDSQAERDTAHQNGEHLTEAQKTEKLIARIAAVRYEHEVAGITHDTRYIATDRTSQSKLHAARTKGLEGIAPAAGWKCLDANGNIVWWACTASEIVAAANAAFDYVDACFVREKELALSVADGTFTEADLETGWP